MKLKRGFTMVEVIVVIGIVAILTVIIFPSISNIRAKNRDAERVADIAALQLGLSLYKNQNGGVYPPTLRDSSFSSYITNESIVDPRGNDYTYVPLKRGASSDCIYYHLGETLELPSSQIDSANEFDSTVQPTVPGGYTWCGNYSGPGINGNSSQNGGDPLMYDVHP